MKHLFTLLLLAACLTASAQYMRPEDAIKQQSQASPAQAEKAPKAAKAEKPAKPRRVIDAKYDTGACPEVDGKVEWRATLPCPALSAQQAYDRMLTFLMAYCKEEGKDKNSQVALVNPATHEIGTRIQEYIVFKRAALSLDRAMFCYTLVARCRDGAVDVQLYRLSYQYENQSIPAEDMLSDRYALNAKRGGFNRGGYEKFRTKTIDFKDGLFRRLQEELSR